MSLKEAEMHAISAVAAVLIVASVAGPTLWMTSAAAPVPELEEHTVIEASLAMRKEKANQPQKKFRPPDPIAKPVGVDQKDDRKPPDPKKPDDVPKHADDKPQSTDIDKFKHGDPDDPVGPTTAPAGDFNPGEKEGFGDVSKGDPWLGKLNADMEFAPPEIAKGTSEPIGCIHLTPDGKIIDTKFDVKSDDDLETAAEAAIAKLKKTRNDHPDPVPDRLLSLTTKWLCFQFSVKQ